MNKEHPLYKRLRDLKDVLDALIILELQNVDNSTKLKKLFAKRTEVVKEIVVAILENEAIWIKDTGGLNTSREAIKSLKHSTNLIAKLEKVALKTTGSDLKQDLQDGIKECIENMEGVLTKWVEWIDPKNKPQDLVSTTELRQLIAKHQPSQTIPQESSEEQTKETTEQESQKSSDIIAKEPIEIATQNLSPVDDIPTKTPTLAKDLSIANKGKIVMHNNIYKVNLGMLSELENNLFFNLFNRLKDKRDTIIRFTSKELKALAGDSYMSNTRLYKLTLDLFNNIAGANFDLIKHLPNDSISRSKVMFFRVFTIEYDKQKNVKYLDIQVNDPYFTYLLNDLKANFTSMKLQTFVDLSGKYAKNLFRLLERFKNDNKSGVFQVHMYENNLEGFCNFMGVPKDFRTNSIDSRVIKPAIQQLTQKTPKTLLNPPTNPLK
ncbi:hypothetical protein NHP190002_05700 [Helicobacter ailurogastricus]|uniref:replication initiation protein n=1 Tax=Helicobacter ailurogastricus TaxID=1578720 RepID=UPI00244D8190|nr:replication initiation protein [Helicobacter ailurogastricus]GMB89891.1 hypothetical protein NHP190002_05700 [Helicobacter ailurogastricus]